MVSDNPVGCSVEVAYKGRRAYGKKSPSQNVAVGKEGSGQQYTLLSSF